MTDIEREDLAELIREILEEHERIHPYHRRDTLVSFKDPQGRPWYSATVSKVQAISAVLTLLVTIFAGIWASMAVRDELVVYPRVNGIVRVQLDEHERDVRAEMSALRPTMATRTELDALAKEVAVSRAERIEQYTAIQAQLDRIERRLEKMGR